jgi:hypothetical protein
LPSKHINNTCALGLTIGMQPPGERVVPGGDAEHHTRDGCAPWNPRFDNSHKDYIQPSGSTGLCQPPVAGLHKASATPRRVALIAAAKMLPKCILEGGLGRPRNPLISGKESSNGSRLHSLRTDNRVRCVRLF